jgi:hypothetical protein
MKNRLNPGLERLITLNSDDSRINSQKHNSFFKRLNQITIPLALFLAGFATSQMFGSEFFMSPLKKYVSHARASPEIIAKKIEYHEEDNQYEPKLELLIEDEFRLKLRIPKGYSAHKLDRFYSYLVYVKNTNPNLAAALEGKDIYLLPHDLSKNYGGIANPDFIELFDHNDILAPLLSHIVHEANHALMFRYEDRGKNFLEGWKRIVEKFGYRYNQGLAPPGQVAYKSTEWRYKKGTIEPVQGHKRFEQRGVFLSPYSANLNSKGLPIEHPAVLHQSIYEGKFFFADSKNAERCHLALLKYALDNRMLSQKEYESALHLIVPYNNGPLRPPEN